MRILFTLQGNWNVQSYLHAHIPTIRGQHYYFFFFFLKKSTNEHALNCYCCKTVLRQLNEFVKCKQADNNNNQSYFSQLPHKPSAPFIFVQTHSNCQNRWDKKRDCAACPPVALNWCGKGYRLHAHKYT